MTWDWDYEDTTPGYYHIYSDADFVIVITTEQTPEMDGWVNSLVDTMNENLADPP